MLLDQLENILLITDASINNLKEIWGQDEVDFRRFLPNLFISLKEKIPFIEEWIGRPIKIGSEVEIQLVGHCKRCMIILLILIMLNDIQICIKRL
ncbi:MOSC domain-containing protein [Alkalihalobacillus deserti]|uniref:MOSC domain-containing protein n=1 Tax=Alkalihalobacillus deserti TaxID=2879466 RepID=UPI00355798D8